VPRRMLLTLCSSWLTKARLTHTRSEWHRHEPGSQCTVLSGKITASSQHTLRTASTTHVPHHKSWLLQLHEQLLRP
jgi:hypothetical protein